MVTSTADFGDLQTKPKTHIYPYILYLFENPTPRTMQWWPLKLICVTSKPNNAYLPLFDISFSKHHTKDMAMVTSAALKKVYHVNIHLFGGLYWRSILEVTQCRCRGHHCIVLGLGFKKCISCKDKCLSFRWPPIEATFWGHLNHLQRSQFFALCP